MAAMAPLLAALLALLVNAQGPPPQRQKMEAPKWLSDTGKDLFNDIESDDKAHSDLACENREKLLKLMAGKGDKGASDYRARVLLGLGLCEFKKENFAMAKKRLDNAIGEMNVPSEDMMLQNPNLAPIALTKQSADFLNKFEVTQAGTQLRRCREILNRNMKQILKQVHQQMGQQQGEVPPLDKFVEELPGLGKTGQFLPMIVNQVPMLRESFAFTDIIETTLDSIDKKVAAVDASQKSKKMRLDVSKGKSKGGSLLYARALFTDPVVPGERLTAAQELVDGGAAKALMDAEEASEKAGSLIKRTQPGSGCKGGLDALCKKLEKVADIQSNVFGETRLLVLKDGKKQALEVCSTNANVGILLAAKDGATLTVPGQEPTALEAGKPVVFDFCLEASLEASSKVPVLFAQAWHPEFAAVERTTELRSRAKSFGLSEDEVKAVVKVVNDNAKKAWEKNAKLWRSSSEGIAKIRQSLESHASKAQKSKEEAEEAARQEEEGNDDERKKKLEELEKKRAAKKKQQEEAEAKRIARKKQLEEEKAKRDPWLLSPEVVAAEKKVEDLKEERRDANAKLEFDLSTSLTKEIAAAERALKSATKKAKKAYKKGGAAAGSADKEKTEAATKTKEEKKASGEVEELKAKLKDIKKRKAEASEAENFKEAKKLKAEEKELEEKLKKLEL
mmetsp:Transcript_49747/g.89333  ORF Transcript_49747/g.89333 Transcript_49747/m.89333 type:complete len:677 (-) Transcript_49747:61-2091(-)|eukprot:CAMPEP_0197632210 /NCGR_PEP_ID=MMETSP1338-20131121/9062_1 /TAXON_ID=43686 ORGANISM="Pelagodinium beii, Strain RCC1491" /NCGR_SAMPLE_ID=MMETSP1338 /ASSEMBLY_ACC=CAM_ASM_000754 /LENGTH=676 /DNA_ID=CAMNT_0043203763 /DNA_START=70 /DNA_END=2100 /DNA_ORIENTATION=-